MGGPAAQEGVGRTEKRNPSVFAVDWESSRYFSRERRSLIYEYSWLLRLDLELGAGRAGEEDLWSLLWIGKVSVTFPGRDNPSPTRIPYSWLQGFCWGWAGVHSVMN